MTTLLIGVLRRPHGINGAIKVESYSGETDHFRHLEDVDLISAGKTVKVHVQTIAIHNGVPVLTFEGIETPEEVKKYTGWEIRVPRSVAAPLKDDEYYVADLVGSLVYGERGQYGVVVAVVDGAQAPLLEIELTQEGPTGRDGDRVLVPLSDHFVDTVDVNAGRIDIKEQWIVE